MKVYKEFCHVTGIKNPMSSGLKTPGLISEDGALAKTSHTLKFDT